MGGLFSSPKPPAPAPEPPVVAPPSTEEAERTERLKNLERRRRGRQGTIQTSWRGLEERTGANGTAPSKPKTLLGD